MRKTLLLLITIWIIIHPSASLTSAASVAYEGYTYNYWGEKKIAPPAFVPSRMITSDDLGTGPLSNPSDLFISDNGIIALSDTDNNRVLLMNSDFTITREIAAVEYNGATSSLANPEGLFIDDDGELYICDTGNNRIIRFSAEGKVVNIYTRPDSPLLDGFSVFSPVRVVVDKSKKMYIISKGINMGILELDENGVLDKFIGAPLVYVNKIDYFWKSIASKAQTERMSSYVPTEYNNIFLDHEGFIYATTDSVTEDQIVAKVQSRDRSTDSSPVKRLTLGGEDVLSREGFFPPVGDVRFPVNGQDYVQDGDSERTYLKESEKGPSALSDVTATTYGIYSVLDSRRGRIFTYDYEGNLLYVFGGVGAQIGTFLGAVSLCDYGQKFYVLDKVTGSITEFVRTEYGTAVLDAINLYNSSEYEKSLEQWNYVVKRDANSEIAYLGIGKIHLMQNDFTGAMGYFNLANSREYYSKAMKLYKNKELGRGFGIAIFAMIAVALIIAVIFQIRKALLVMIHFGKAEPRNIGRDDG
ncbi:MAG: NHL repeat-containing protein [Saccharofermentanales bacterium]